MKRILCIVLLVLILSLTAFATETNFSSFDLRTKSFCTAAELDEVLKYELKGLGEHFLSAEEKHGVNALFLASVAALESGWGRYCFKKNNMFGYGNMSFSSKAECIDFVAMKLKENYLSENGKYHNGYTVDAVNVRYNGRSEWAETVLQIMSALSRKLTQ